jgi:hypothetical protein
VISTAPNPSSFDELVVLTATVTAADHGSLGGIVTFLDGPTTVGTGTVGPNGTATFDDASLSVGSNEITANYSGDVLHSPSTSNTVAQVVQPSSIVAPTVVSLARFGFHMQQTSLVIAFSTALDAASAENMHNYQIMTLGGHGRGGTLVGRATAVRKAIYDPSQLTVTLLLAHRLDIHNTYRLTVNGTAQTGVRGTSGLLLGDSAAGDPGANYQALITWRTLAGPAPGFAAKTKRTAAEHDKQISIRSSPDRDGRTAETERLVARANEEPTAQRALNGRIRPPGALVDSLAPKRAPLSGIRRRKR